MTDILNHLSIFCRKIFYTHNTRIFIIANDFLSIVIIASILAIILESVTGLSKYHQFFLTIEYIAVIIFTIEYIGRIIGSKKKISYIFSLFGLIDLISILPSWLHMANLTPLKSVRALRILRFLRILRITKATRLGRLKKPSKDDTAAIIRLDLQIYFLAIIFTVAILGTLTYAFEHDHAHFENIPLSMLWVFESLLGGSISGIVPETYGGITIFMIARFISFVLLGFMIQIIGNIISYLLIGKKTNKTIRS